MKYRVKNWREYNQALVNRGNLTIWFDEETLKSWMNTEKTGKKGASNKYSDMAIQCCLVLKNLFRLPLRATQGLLMSLFLMLGVEAETPHYSTLSRRQASTQFEVPAVKAENCHLVVDSTGLKVYGEGEWKTRKHGWSKRRTWRKLHLGVDADTNMILCHELTENGKGDGDSQVFPELLDQVEGTISQVSGDGAYDTWDCHEAIAVRGAKATVPPQKGAKIKQHGNGKAPPLPRDEIIRRIRKVGRKKWKEESGDHKRSLSETAMFRMKTILGSMLSARKLDSQKSEASIRCIILNQMTQLGMPESYEIES